MIARRSIITGLVALVAAPAIVKASSLMPVKATNTFGVDWGPGTTLTLTLDEYSERILQPMVGQLADQIADEMISGRGIDVLYGSLNLGVGTPLRIRLPDDFATSDGPSIDWTNPAERLFYEEAATIPDSMWQRQREINAAHVQVPAGLALGVAAMTAMAVAPQVLAKPVTRRFWSK